MAQFQMMFQQMMKIRGIEADASEPLFRVKAVGGGFLAQMLGMGSKASITVNEDGFRLQKTTFGSDENTYIPRQQIASSVCLVMKPLELLVLGIATLIILVGIVFIVLYFIGRRRVIIGVVSSGGTVESLKLKANDDELAEIREGMAILDELIRTRGAAAAPERSERPERPAKAAVEEKAPAKPWDEPRKPKSASGSASAPALRPPPAPAADTSGTRIISCPACGTRMSVPASATGRKVRCTSCREVFPVPAE